MRIRIEESVKMPGKLQSTKNLRKLMLSGLAQKMDFVAFFKKISNKVLTEQSKRFSVSYVLSDGKFGCYYLDDYYFFVTYAVVEQPGKILNQVRIACWAGEFYAGFSNNVVSLESPQEARNLVAKLSRDPSIAKKYGLSI